MVKVFTLAKDPAMPEQNEDATVVGKSRLALADGASSDAFAELWAQTLCEEFVSSGTLDRERAALIWHETVRQHPLPWFLADKLRQPTHASFLGAEWDQMQLQIQAVGDTCVFVVRDDMLVFAFPFDSAEHFSTLPTLVPTRGTLPEVRHTSFLLQPSDLVLFATDALAAWFLREQDRQPWRALLALQNESDFARWVQSLRSASRMALDDTTAILIG